MTDIKTRSNRTALFGTVAVWILLVLLFSLSSLLPHKQVYKTVKIRLDSPAASKTARVQEAAPPKAENTSAAVSTPPQAPAQQSKGSAQPAKSEKASAPAAKTQKTQSKPAVKPAAKTASKPVPAPAPAATQTLQKSVEELMAEQMAAKPKQKKTVNWDEMFADDETEENSSKSVSTAASARTVDALQGTAAQSSTAASSAVSSSSKNSSAAGTVSQSTSQALGKIASTVYSHTAGNGVTSQSQLSTVSSSSGKTNVAMSDGSARELLEPKEPVILLSDAAAATVDSTKEFKISFMVTAEGRVPVNGIVIPKSIVSSLVANEIAAQISKWRFQSAATDGQATFIYTIRKR